MPSLLSGGGTDSLFATDMRCSLALLVLLSLVDLRDAQSDTRIESVLNNPRILNAYLKCVLSTGPCTKEGRELKRLIPEVLRTACKACNPKHKEHLRKFLRRVQLDPKLTDAWRKVMEKYDPQRQYQPGLLKFINEN